MKRVLPNQLQLSLPVLFLLLTITECRGYIDFLPPKDNPKPREPKCQVSYIWFNLSTGIKGDTAFYHYDSKGNLAYASRVIHRTDGTVTRSSREGPTTPME